MVTLLADSLQHHVGIRNSRIKAVAKSAPCLLELDRLLSCNESVPIVALGEETGTI